jgi:hypothetical protein
VMYSGNFMTTPFVFFILKITPRYLAVILSELKAYYNE